MVDSHDHGDVFVLAWSGNDDFLRPRFDMSLGFVRVCEQTCRLNHDINVEFGPGESRRFARADNPDFRAIDDEHIIFAQLAQQLFQLRSLFGDPRDFLLKEKCIRRCKIRPQ